jgi:hypothetical protein
LKANHHAPEEEEDGRLKTCFSSGKDCDKEAHSSGEEFMVNTNEAAGDTRSI